MTVEADEPFTEGQRPLVSGFVDLTAGSAGAAASVLVGQPLDTVKVKMQTFPSLYPDTWRCLVATWRCDGVRRGLYAGTVPALVANVAENSVLFCAYGFCQRLVARAQATVRGRSLDETPDRPSVLGSAAAGCLAGFFCSFSLCPTELVKCRLQALRETATASSLTSPSCSSSACPAPSRPPHFPGPFSMTRHIVHTEGVRGLFAGLTATMLREVPGYFFFFGGYEGTRALLSYQLSGDDRGHRERVGAAGTVLAGGVGGCLLWLVVFPADVVKSRLQVSGSRRAAWRVARDVLRVEGAASLYSGLTATLLRTFPATGVLFLVYEWTRKLLHDIMA